MLTRWVSEREYDTVPKSVRAAYVRHGHECTLSILRHHQLQPYQRLNLRRVELEDIEVQRGKETQLRYASQTTGTSSASLWLAGGLADTKP